MLIAKARSNLTHVSSIFNEIYHRDQEFKKREIEMLVLLKEKKYQRFLEFQKARLKYKEFNSQQILKDLHKNLHEIYNN